MNRFAVAAGILRTDDHRVLITERLGDGPFAGLWEFPGGKIESDETAELALRRELAEEIGVVVLGCRQFLELEHQYPDRHVRIAFFLVNRWQNEPSGLEGQGVRWVPVSDLHGAGLLPADEPVVDELVADYRRCNV